jgi:hypothetical protein
MAANWAWHFVNFSVQNAARAFAAIFFCAVYFVV